ncbi:MAG: hypothetical protein ABL959_20660, partial [Pyrinomonadaceae bacterium]
MLDETRFPVRKSPENRVAPAEIVNGLVRSPKVRVAYTPKMVVSNRGRVSWNGSFRNSAFADPESERPPKAATVNSPTGMLAKPPRTLALKSGRAAPELRSPATNRWPFGRSRSKENCLGENWRLPDGLR